MTLEDAERALGAKLKPFASSGFTDQACWQTSRADGTEPFVIYMFETGTLTRIDIRRRDGQPIPPVRTAEGLGIGSSEQQVLAAYGDRARQSPHPYLGNEGKYLEVLSPDRRGGILFESEQGVVTSYRAGLLPSLEYKEGCS